MRCLLCCCCGSRPAKNAAAAEASTEPEAVRGELEPVSPNQDDKLLEGADQICIVCPPDNAAANEPGASVMLQNLANNNNNNNSTDSDSDVHDERNSEEQHVGKYVRRILDEVLFQLNLKRMRMHKPVIETSPELKTISDGINPLEQLRENHLVPGSQVRFPMLVKNPSGWEATKPERMLGCLICDKDKTAALSATIPGVAAKLLNIWFPELKYDSTERKASLPTDVTVQKESLFANQVPVDLPLHSLISQMMRTDCTKVGMTAKWVPVRNSAECIALIFLFDRPGLLPILELDERNFMDTVDAHPHRLVLTVRDMCEETAHSIRHHIDNVFCPAELQFALISISKQLKFLVEKMPTDERLHPLQECLDVLSHSLALLGDPQCQAAKEIQNFWSWRHEDKNHFDLLDIYRRSCLFHVLKGKIDSLDIVAKQLRRVLPKISGLPKPEPSDYPSLEKHHQKSWMKFGLQDFKRRHFKSGCKAEQLDVLWIAAGVEKCSRDLVHLTDWVRRTERFFRSFLTESVQLSNVVERLKSCVSRLPERVQEKFGHCDEFFESHGAQLLSVAQKINESRKLVEPANLDELFFRLISMFNGVMACYESLKSNWPEVLKWNQFAYSRFRTVQEDTEYRANVIRRTRQTDVHGWRRT